MRFSRFRGLGGCVGFCRFFDGGLFDFLRYQLSGTAHNVSNFATQFKIFRKNFRNDIRCAFQGFLDVRYAFFGVDVGLGKRVQILGSVFGVHNRFGKGHEPFVARRLRERVSL